MRISGFVTVIVPVRNGALTIRRCLDAVAAQTYRPLELVVVDDGSTDSTPGWVRSFRASHPEIPVQVITQRATGMGAALNAAIAQARGEFLAFAESGDEWLPEKLARQVAQLQANERVAASTGGVAVRVGADERLVPAARHLLDEPMPASSLVVRRSAVEEAGGFDPSTAASPLHDLCFRLSRRGGVARLRERVAVCHHKERPALPTAQLAATLEKLASEGHFTPQQLRLGQSRLFALHGWQALLADEPERACEAFGRAMGANPWLPITWSGMACAKLDQWLFRTGLLKPDAKRQLAHAKR